MSQPETVAEFLPAFFAIFTKRGFPGGGLPSYLQRPAAQRGGDEASVVDTAIVGPLLGLLGFAPGEWVYNQQHQQDRPDFAPYDDVYGTYFLVEDKNTTLDLTLDLADPDSHLSQLARYVRAKSVRLGLLTNGHVLTAWRFDGPTAPAPLFTLDVPAALAIWNEDAPEELPVAMHQAVADLFTLFHKSAFTDPARLEEEIATTLEEWERQALPLGAGGGHEKVLVESLQALVQGLAADARRILQEHLTRYADYRFQSERLEDDAPVRAAPLLEEQKRKVRLALENGVRTVVGLESADVDSISAMLGRLEQDASAYESPKALLDDVLVLFNTARTRGADGRPKPKKALLSLDEFAVLRDALLAYAVMAFTWHQRRAALRQEYRAAIGVHNDYEVWASLVKETMLGELTDAQKQDEFALQAAYVIFIRLLLIRVCEDKGIFPTRFLTDGGLRHWQEDIKRYLRFAQGNPYDPLLDMAYANAQNIYAHFFTGRELFNWYRLGRERLVLTLHQLSRFNFALVDSDIVGTVYNTYVNRKEKKEKGQYYTPLAVVHYILDEVGYKDKAMLGSNKRLLDPACGSGTFLVAASRRLVDAYRDPSGVIADPVSVLNKVQNSLFGFDLNPFACYLAEVNLLIQALDLVKAAHDAGHRPRLAPFHVYNVDALARPSGTGMFFNAHFNTRLAEENDRVEQIKRRQGEYATGFAFVVANPPYGAKLTDAYKETLRLAWPEVFRGKPDTYTFFFKLGLELLGRGGRLGFITPNTFLMGTNTNTLRWQLLSAGRIEQIVDLPQGIWPDATVDCVLLFLAAEPDAEKRRAQAVQVNLLGLKDDLSKLTSRTWAETLTQPQSVWLDDVPRHEMNFRFDDLLQKIEDACEVPVNGSGAKKVLRLGDITDSSPGIDPYETEADGKANFYIKPRREVPANEAEWKPLLDTTAFVGRYELRWGKMQPYIKYGEWLCRPREPRFFEAPKLLVQDMRNRSLKRRLIATFDAEKFYHRKNYNNIISEREGYDLKYILALFNSSLLNYWFTRRSDNLHINPSYFRQLPIFPADAATQAEIVAEVDALLDAHTRLNALRAQGYTIAHKRDGTIAIAIPVGPLLDALAAADPDFPRVSLFDAEAMGQVTLPAECDTQTQIGSSVFTPPSHPETVVLRRGKLWLVVPDAGLRRYLVGALGGPQWRGRTWDEVKNALLAPETPDARQTFFAAEAAKRAEIEAGLAEIARRDAALEERVLNLYGITEAGDRRRILGSAPPEEDEADETAMVAA